MRKFLCAVAMLCTFAASANAQQYGQPYPQQQQQRRGNHDGNDVRDAAIAGVVVGAILGYSANNNGYRRPTHQRGYYGQPYPQGYGQPMYVQPPPRYVMGQHYQRRNGYLLDTYSFAPATRMVLSIACRADFLEP